MTVGEMLGRMSSAEFTEWMALDTFDPVGGLRGDIQAAVVAQVVAEVNRDTKRRRRPFELSDFMPLQRAMKPRQTLKQMYAVMKAAFGG